MGKKACAPETLRQAQRWDTVKGAYLQVGLCERCAGQAAWGHQIGFSMINPPCEKCVHAVAAFPIAAVAPWRKKGGLP